MRKPTLLLAGLVGFSSWASAVEPDVLEIPANFDAWNLNFKLPIEKLPAPENVAPANTMKHGMMKSIRKEASQKEYFVAAQSYHSNYQFIYSGGDIKTYNIGISVDGDEVTISNFFDLAAQSTEWAVGVDYDVKGKYDAAAKTITIPTPTNFENATIAGTIGDYYTEVVISGTVTEEGKMAPSDELVFNVEGDFESISTDMSFGIMNYTSDGSMAFGTQILYRSFQAYLPGEEPRLISFNSSYDLGQTYSDLPVTGNFTVINVSGVDVDYAVEIESDNDTFSVNPDGGTISACSTQNFEITFLSSETGEYEGLLLLEYDGDAETPDPLTVLYNIEVVAAPDYSPVVKEGDFIFQTNIDFPFEVTTLDDGMTVARSTLNGQAGTSQLNVEFDVPEDNVGIFSWKGRSVNTGQMYQNMGGYFIDNSGDAAAIFLGLDDDISSSMEFGPGKHSVRFQYEGLQYSGDPENGLYVYDLSLENVPAKDNDVVVETPDLNLGNLLIKDNNGAEIQGAVILRNKGVNPLSVENAVSSDPLFTMTIPTTTASLMETLAIPVLFKCEKPGEYSSELTITTSAGTVVANVRVFVREMADFSQVVTKGTEYITSYSTDESYPFDVVDGVAYNANSGYADDEPATSWFQIDIEIPAGKAGYLTWDGILYGDVPDPANPWQGDYSGVDISHPMTAGELPTYPNETDASSNKYLSDDFWKSYLTFIPGSHTVRFKHYKNGDGHISEKDRVEISNICLVVEDFPEYGAKPERETVEFEPIFAGEQRFVTEFVKLFNTGSQTLIVESVIADGPFDGIIPNWNQAQFNESVEVGIKFSPAKEGDYEGNVIFKTTAGDVVVKCHGTTKSMEGIILAGDVENEGYGWSSYNADGDPYCWDLGTNRWGEVPEYSHSGKDSFVSNSFTWDLGAITPDNWLISPSFTVPEDGAVLNWYSAGFDDENFYENYSLYIASPDDISNPENLESLEPVFSQTIPYGGIDGWVENVFELTDYAGKTICLCFRHHDCTGQYILRLDDIFVYTNEKWSDLSSISSIGSDVVSTEIYDINGVRLNTLKSGMNIVRRTYSDGSVKTSKIIVK